MSAGGLRQADLLDGPARSTRRNLGEAALAAPLAAPIAPNRADQADPAPASPSGAEDHRKRLRERLLRAGPDALSDHELLEATLFLAILRQDTKPIARRLLERFGSYANAVAAPHRDLLGVEGLGPSGAAALKIVHAAALRLSRAEIIGRPVLSNWQAVLDYLNAAMSRDPVEQFRLLFLDNRNRLIADEAQTRGTVNHTPVYPREVVRRALELNASALILAHNHPSGDPSPSRDDIAMTRQIMDALATVAITVHDHVIIGNGRSTSLRQEGLL